MKLEALDHPKTLDLASRLNVELPTVIGHLELLWAFAGKKAPQGNIGKWPDGAIARACYWMGQPDFFVGALCDSGFVDRDAASRLVIHDWQEHAPRWVKLKLTNLGLGFIESIGPTSEHPIEPAITSLVRPPIESTSKGSEDKPREGKGERRVTAPRLATRIPDDFSLTEDRRAIAAAERVDPDRTFAKFRDHWLAASGSAGRKADWEATWRNWCRREADNRKPQKNGSASITDRISWRPTE